VPVEIIEENNWHIIKEHSSVIKITVSVARKLYIKICKPNPGSEAGDILLLPGPLRTDGKMEEMHK